MAEFIAQFREEMALFPQETSWWVKHPNHGWVEVDCACTAADVSVLLRQLGEEPWPISLGEPPMYKIKCTVCGATAWVRGSYDLETNATEVDDEDAEWEGDMPNCDCWNHYEIADEEDDSTM